MCCGTLLHARGGARRLIAIFVCAKLPRRRVASLHDTKPSFGFVRAREGAPHHRVRRSWGGHISDTRLPFTAVLLEGCCLSSLLPRLSCSFALR